MEAEKGLFVVGHGVGTHKIIVLIYVWYEIVILVPTWKHLRIALEPIEPYSIRKTILIIVVLNQFDNTFPLAVIVYFPSASRNEGARIV